MLFDIASYFTNICKRALGIKRDQEKDYVPITPVVVKQRPTVIDCGYAQANMQGFKGSPAHWKELKAAYVAKLTPEHSVIDCNNLLFDGQGIQDADGNWHR